MTLPRSRRGTAAAAAAAALLALAACSSGSDDGGGSDAGPAPAASMADEPADTAAGVDSYSDENSLRVRSGVDEVEEAPGMEKAIISTGNVALESKDVEQAAFEVQQVVDEYGGEITDQKTNTDQQGEVRHARMVVRVPSDSFSEAFADLEDAADLTSSSSTSEDVTTQVIDNQVRIRAQRRSIQRIAVLLDRAQSIRDIVSIEAQLTRRQADLDSLEQQQAYLQDQTSMSTITVTIERTPAEPKDEKDEEESGFLAGLSDGWDALGRFGTAVATVTGQVLPFAAVLLLLGVPVWLLVRGVVRRRPKGAVATDAGS